ncbi:MAG TPA: trypsin-like peptidase domain-containing protein [Blastocatellia bacterium]|nr:trypsin-like peptidase domain-containing protein [Blastocatellia bacterium]
MKAYQVSAKQLVLLSLVTAVFAGSVVVFYDRIGPALLGRLAGARVETLPASESAIPGLTDPSVATDERNNQEIYNSLSPGVVNITTTTVVRDWFAAYETQGGSGSGAILDKEGHILTNFHVVQGARKLVVALANNNHYDAKPIGVDPDNDLAVVKIDAPRETLTPIPLGSSKELFVGQKVLAIGNPFGLDRTLTTGIVSGLARPLRSEFTDRLIEGVIQTDAAINPGNSGGPLLDSRGRMVGINTMIFSPSGGSVGIGFAVPVDTARKIVPDILAYGRVRRPKLGVTSYPLDSRLAEALELPVQEGIMVMQVYPGTAAARAGIKGGDQQVRIGNQIAYIGGDVITGIDGQPVRTRDDLDRILGAKKIGDRVQVDVVRGRRRVTLEVELTEPPANRG